MSKILRRITNAKKKRERDRESDEKEEKNTFLQQVSANMNDRYLPFEPITIEPTRIDSRRTRCLFAVKNRIRVLGICSETQLLVGGPWIETIYQSVTKARLIVVTTANCFVTTTMSFQNAGLMCD